MATYRISFVNAFNFANIQLILLFEKYKGGFIMTKKAEQAFIVIGGGIGGLATALGIAETKGKSIGTGT